MDEDTPLGGMTMSSPDTINDTQMPSNSGKIARSGSKASNGSVSTTFPTPKTDKPRPHVCTTCMRSFARLEHLKRHERSHTKEKPFECPECTRCFARRDLLLRHQQKLHSTTTPSSRPRSGRRESAAGVTTGRVRKNSVANSNAPGMRPRANTLSHVDTGALGLFSNSPNSFARNLNSSNHHTHHNSFAGIPGPTAYQYRGMSNGHHSSMMGLPKLETGLSADLNGGLRTAPPYGGFGAEFGLDTFPYSAANASTINPHVLHLHNMQSLNGDGTLSPYQQFFGAASGHAGGHDDEQNFDWIAHGFENQMSFAQANENAIDDSSPSAMSTNSPAGVSELMLDGSTTTMHNMPVTMTAAWQANMMNQTQIVNSPGNMEFPSSTFNEMLPAPAGTISPKSLLAQTGLGLDINFPTPPDMSNMDATSMAAGFGTAPFHLPYVRHGGASTASTSSRDSSLQQSSVTTMSSDLVNENIRNVLIAGLAQNSGFGQRTYSQPSISSPLSTGSTHQSRGFNISTFPSTQDLQRYVLAYIQYFHPHLPFLHIPSLSFDTPEFSTPISSMNATMQFGPTPIAGGGGCLILAMAAIGALYEHDMANSRELFESAKRLINCFLEERRKVNLSRTQFAPGHHMESEDTPLWLVQAMLLNVIYGHNCGDKTAAEVASNHCAALVSLARGAELARPYSGYLYMNGGGHSMASQSMHMNNGGTNGWNSIITEPDDTDWFEWKIAEERKRTLYAVFILSSLLVSAYNHAPALTNSEIRLDLPCEEELWCAENAQTWRSLGGASLAESKSIAFGAALGHLLTASQRQQHRHSHGSPLNESHDSNVQPAESELRPSSFGCLILVNALHNYIWETRQRHLGRQWTAQETEQMHAHIAPALKAWSAAWASNPTHSLERPNPFGAGPLSADSIPLLDLAYVRLFVNLGRSKEAFWQRDYDAMAVELAKGPEVAQPLDVGDESTDGQTQRGSLDIPESIVETDIPDRPVIDTASETISNFDRAGLNLQKSAGHISLRERHLRKAAFYAADSLSMSDKLGLTFADQTSRELPLQSAMCAFDCAQVLAEWVTTVQGRVGKYLGIIGRDPMDLLEIPGLFLLEDEDRRLLEKIDSVLQSADHKMSIAGGDSGANDCGHGSKILVLTAHMLERAAVWPVTKLMARSLETQAGHMKERALKSVTTRV